MSDRMPTVVRSQYVTVGMPSGRPSRTVHGKHGWHDEFSLTVEQARELYEQLRHALSD